MDEDLKNVARELMLEELMSWGYCDRCPYYKDKNCTVDDNITKGRCFQEWVNSKTPSFNDINMSQYKQCQACRYLAFDGHCVCHYTAPNIMGHDLCREGQWEDINVG